MVGAILAGGAGDRLGGRKAARELAGRPLIAYPAQALGAACSRVAVVCKPGAALPALEGVELWDDEPAEPRHPAAGIAHALERAAGGVLVCAADMPFVTAADCRRLIDAAADRPGSSAVVAVCSGQLQPVFGIYAAAAATPLGLAARRGDPLTRAVELLEPVGVELPAGRMRSVNTPEQLAAAESELLSRGGGR
ncbi:MAG: molybdenum cofactor guanylyltransferase [Thermoleophilaceae bacterium]|nr:molybdenum cofactor guanylyltransferase [Thermoleophilaceae bacterium]